jgi:hypothetical protein
MTGAEKAIDQLLAAINQGKDLPPRYQPGVTLGFPDLDVFTPEALDRIKVLAGGDPTRIARLSAHVLKIAQRECAVPVLPDLVDDAAAQVDLERAGPEGAQPYDEHSAPQTYDEHSDSRPVVPQDLPLAEPSARHDPHPYTPGPYTGRPQTGEPHTDRTAPSGGAAPNGRAAPSVSAPRRILRRATLVLGVVLVAAGVVGFLAYTGQLNTLGVVSPEGQRQEIRSGDRGGSSPTEPVAESEPPAGPSGGTAVPEDDDREETPNEAVDHPLREGDRREEERRADEAALAERWPELGEATQNAIKQRFREVREQTDQARQTLDEIASEMEQLHRREYEEMQARHAREQSQASAEGADAVAQTNERHQQERAALQGEYKESQDRLAAVRDELDQQLQSARRDLARARAEAAGQSGEPRAISELQPQSAQTDDRQQQSAATAAEWGADSGSESGVVASGQPESPQNEVPEPTAPQRAQLPGSDEETPPPAELAPGAADSSLGTAAPDAAQAAPAPEDQPASESPSAATPDNQDVAGLVNRGNALLELGDLASARLFYRLAADGGSSEGAMLMGMTFDPVYFARTRIQGTQPQIQDALHWYDKAIAMGSRPAERRMEELHSWLEQSAAAGDARAKAALQQFR